jgi:hypothetical protein
MEENAFLRTQLKMKRVRGEFPVHVGKHADPPLCPDNDEGAGRVWEGWRRFFARCR